ncbi:hypothetical protein L9F63_020444, partial [Diploptera punctata]
MPNQNIDILYGWKGILKSIPVVSIKRHMRVKRCRERKGMKASERINDGASISAARAAQVDDVIASVTLELLQPGKSFIKSVVEL